MTSPDYAVTNYIWTATILAKMALLGILIRKRSSWPFVTYISLSVVLSVTLYVISWVHYGPSYYYVYWTGQIVLNAVLVAVVLKLLDSVFGNVCSVFRTRSTLLFSSVGTLVIVLTSLSILLPMEPSLVAASRLMDRTASIFLLLVFCGMAFISEVFGLVWHRHMYGIAIGFLFTYSVEAFLNVAMALWGFAVPALNVIEVTIGLGSALIWIGYFFRDQKRQKISPQEIEQLRELLAA